MLVPPQTTLVTTPTPAQPAGATIANASDALAHELAHACGLLHDNEPDVVNGDITNLMYWSSRNGNNLLRGNNLSSFQRAIIRSSPHVTYF